MFCSILLRSGHLDINVLLHSIKVWTLDTHKKLVRRIVMYANIAAHRAVRSWFLRLIVNVVICAPWGGA